MIVQQGGGSIENQYRPTYASSFARYEGGNEKKKNIDQSRCAYEVRRTTGAIIIGQHYYNLIGTNYNATVIFSTIIKKKTFGLFRTFFDCNIKSCCAVVGEQRESAIAVENIVCLIRPNDDADDAWRREAAKTVPNRIRPGPIVVECSGRTVNRRGRVLRVENKTDWISSFSR